MKTAREWISRVHDTISKMVFPGFISENEAYLPNESGQLAFLIAMEENHYFIHNNVGKALCEISGTEFDRIREMMNEMSYALGYKEATAQKENLLYKLSQTTSVLRDTTCESASRFVLIFGNGEKEHWSLNSKTLTLCIADSDGRRMDHIGNQDVVFDIFEVMSGKVSGVIAKPHIHQLEDDFDV